MDRIKTISIIGAGNVATHLGKALHNAGLIIQEVWSHHPNNAGILANLLNAKSCFNIKDLSTEVDLIIISVKDDVLQSVIKQLPQGVRSVVHTSGSMEMTLLNSAAENVGVFYPLQSFNKDQQIDFTQVPICVEASKDVFAGSLFELGKALSEYVEYINSTQRTYLHIAAVIANNFTNYMYSVSYDLVTEKKLAFNLLIPLIKNTANRLDYTDPFNKQTGPAKRNDQVLMDKHIHLLKDHPEISKLYQLMSELIKKKAGH